MFIWNRYLPLYDTPGDGAASAATPASIPASTIPDARGIDETSSFALEAFDNLQLDETEEDIPDSSLRVEAPASPEGLDGAPTAPPTGVPNPPPQQAPTTSPAVPPAQAMPAQAGAPETPPAQPPSGQQQPSVVESPDQILERMSAQISQYQENFEKQLGATYKISEAELERFNSEPAAVIADIAGRVQARTTSSILKVLSQQLPVWLHGVQAVREEHQAREAEFWNANPGLNRNEHQKVVLELGKWYRGQNPTASRQEFNTVVGRLAQAQLGVVAQAVQQAQAQPSPTAVQTPGRIVRNVIPPAPIPSMHGGSPGSQPPRTRGEWETIAEMMGTYDD